MNKPTIFIGSSKEGLSIANAVFSELEEDCDPRVWDQDQFRPSNYAVEDLERLIHEFEFAVFILTPDDKRAPVMFRGTTLLPNSDSSPQFSAERMSLCSFPMEVLLNCQPTSSG
jgi:hypothetical protein